MNGIGAAVKEGVAVSWNELLHAINEKCDPSHTPFVISASDSSGWGQLARAGLEILADGCAGEQIPAGQFDLVRTILTNVIASDRIWTLGEYNKISCIKDALNAALNNAAGKAIHALIVFSLYLYRVQSAEAGSDPGKEVVFSFDEYRDEFLRLIELAFHQNNVAGITAQAMIGSFLPQLFLLAPDWVRERAAIFIEPGIAEPSRFPFWGTYLTTAKLYDNVFNALKPWYLATSKVVSPDQEERGQYSIPRHLAESISLAALRGLAGPDDEDGLMRDTYRNVPVNARVHSYWYLKTILSNLAENLPDHIKDNAMNFWRWRINEIRLYSDGKTQRDEARGLCHLIEARALPREATIRMASDTVLLADGDIGPRIHWASFGEYLEVDVDAAFEMIEILLNNQLKSDQGYFREEELEPLFRKVIASGSDSVRDRAVELIHKLGEHGCDRLGDLL